MKIKLIAVFFLAFTICNAQDKKYVSAGKVKNHDGETVTVCAKVSGVFFNEKAKGQPTFINFGEPYPNQSFTVVIWKTDLEKFSFKPDSLLVDKKLCVTGKIRVYKERAEMVVNDERQIER